MLKKIVRRLIWLLKFPLHGLAVVARGLGPHAGRPPHGDERPERRERRERRSSAPLSPDEVLWAAELAAADESG